MAEAPDIFTVTINVTFFSEGWHHTFWFHVKLIFLLTNKVAISISLFALLLKFNSLFSLIFFKAPLIELASLKINIK